ncbi:Crp/Fnr family transcriptional regulator [Roseicyclus sp.]|uniref:Crp/Fnr family transcriptional regulator n=1 Tax=Roseicyclus sp. TaxID=1914329 RepID=UPI003F6B07D8
MGCPNANAAFAGLIGHSIREMRARCVLQLAGDKARYVFLPFEGWLVVSKVDPDGARQIVDFVLPGDAFDPASARAAIAAADVAALDHVRLAVIPRDGWHRYLAAHHAAWALFSRQTAAGYSRMAERMLRLGKSSAETRIAYAMCELCLRVNPFGLVAGRAFRLPLTQQVLGEYVGLSSVHVNRTIRAMARAGVLDYRGQIEVMIHDLPALAAMAQIDPEELKIAIIPSPE